MRFVKWVWSNIPRFSGLLKRSIAGYLGWSLAVVSARLPSKSFKQAASWFPRDRFPKSPAISQLSSLSPCLEVPIVRITLAQALYWRRLFSSPYFGDQKSQGYRAGMLHRGP